MCNYNAVCPISNGCGYCCRSCCPYQQHCTTCISCCPPRIDTTHAKSKSNNNPGPSSNCCSSIKISKKRVDNAAGLSAVKSDAMLQCAFASTCNRYSQHEEPIAGDASKLPRKASQSKKLQSTPSTRFKASCSKASGPKYSSWCSKSSSTGSSSGSGPRTYVKTTEYKTKSCGTDDRNFKSAREKKKHSCARSKIKYAIHAKTDKKEQVPSVAREGDLCFQCSVPVRINLPNVLTLKSAAMNSQHDHGKKSTSICASRIKGHNVQLRSADDVFCIYLKAQSEPNEPQPPEQQTPMKTSKNGKLTYKGQKQKRSTGMPKRSSMHRERNTMQDDDIDIADMRDNFLREAEAYRNENRIYRDKTYADDTEEATLASSRNLENLRTNERTLGQLYSREFVTRDDGWNSSILENGNQQYFLEDPLELAELNQLRQNLYTQKGYTNLRNQIRDRDDGYRTNSLPQSLNNAIVQPSTFSRSDSRAYKGVMMPREYQNQSTKRSLDAKSRNNSSYYEDEVLQSHNQYPMKHSIVSKKIPVAGHKYIAAKRLSFEGSASAEPLPTANSYRMQPNNVTKSLEHILVDKLNSELNQQEFHGNETSQPKENYSHPIFEALLKALNNLSNLNLQPSENIDPKTTSTQPPNRQVSSSVDLISSPMYTLKNPKTSPINYSENDSAASTQTTAQSIAATISKEPYSKKNTVITSIADSGNRTITQNSEAVSVRNMISDHHFTSNDVVIPAHAHSATTEMTGGSHVLVLNHNESTIASSAIKYSTGDSFLDYIFGGQILHESTKSDHENRGRSIPSEMSSRPNTKLKSGSSGNSSKTQKNKLSPKAVLSTKLTTKEEENLEIQKTNETDNYSNTGKDSTYDDAANPNPIESIPDPMSSSFETLSQVQDKNLKLASRNSGQIYPLDEHSQEDTKTRALYSEQASKENRNTIDVPPKHEPDLPVQTKALLLPRFFSNSESNIRVPSFTDIPIREEAESHLKKTVLFETTAVCNLRSLIEACSRPPPYVCDGTCTGDEQQQAQFKREYTMPCRQATFSQPQLQSKSDTSLVLMSISEDQTLRSSPIEATRICCNPNCRQNATVLIPVTTISEVPTAFYRQTIQKYGIQPMDSNFKNNGPCHRCSLNRHKTRSYGGFYTYVPDGSTTELLDPPQAYSEPALVHASYQTVVATEQPSTTQNCTDAHCSYFSACMIRH